VSIQLEALAEEVFGAAAAQARLGSHSVRKGFGELIWNRQYPDLLFLNSVSDLVARDWSVADLERSMQEAIPGLRSYRVYSRDPATIANLGRALTDAGYEHEVRIAMVQAYQEVSRDAWSAKRAEFRCVAVGVEAAWKDLEASLHTEGAERGWPRNMSEQYVDLLRWRCENSPHHYALALDAGRPVAHAGWYQHRTTAYLHGIYTHRDQRRRGAARQLTLTMAEDSRRAGCDRVTLQCIDDGYLPAYYGRLGFRSVGEQHIWAKQG
jgi:ribosomal protein S18 acetylase RimI-like enzyme